MTPREQVEAIQLLRGWLASASEVTAERIPEVAEMLAHTTGGSQASITERLTKLLRLREQTTAFLRQTPSA
jgi:hypothetical protein